MKRRRQSLDDILRHLSPVDTGWQDAHAVAVIQRLSRVHKKESYTRDDLRLLLDGSGRKETVSLGEYFKEGMTAVRLFLDMSKDEFTAKLKDSLGPGIGIRRLQERPDEFFQALEDLGTLSRMALITNTPVTWADLLAERLKGGRGSAIKGQRRGRYREDFVERLVINIFEKDNYHARCRFTGAKGISDEKADFAIPSKDDPAILIEAKAYGATGSKQTDVLGDITRICREKRNDTHFLLVTDGITWRE